MSQRHGWEIVTGVTCVACPDCGFVMGAEHENPEGDGYSCPCCAEVAAPDLLEALRDLVHRLNAARVVLAASAERAKKRLAREEEARQKKALQDAAPDLLEALRDLVHAITPDPRDAAQAPFSDVATVSRDRLNAARVVLARVEGAVS